MLDREFDDAVVGAGIVGLATAYHLASRGRRVVVIERSAKASGASVRNFGMLWPIGQPAGPDRDLALRSLGHWSRVLRDAGLWHDPCGSLHLAYRDDEARVFAEFAEGEASSGLGGELIGPGEVRRLSPGVRLEGLRSAYRSPAEVCVDPREVVAGLPGFLAESLGVRFESGRAVVGYDRPAIRLGDGESWSADRLWVCPGSDLETIYPEAFRDQGVVLCKLQMLRTEPVGGDWKLGPMLAAGLTLRHYRSFEGCPSLAGLRERVARESPELDRFGIHVMASQNGRGEVVVGDSHEYWRRHRALRPRRDRGPDPRLSPRIPRRPRVPDRRPMERDLCQAPDPAGLDRPPGARRDDDHLPRRGGDDPLLRDRRAGGPRCSRSDRTMTTRLVIFDLAGTTVHDPGAVNRCFLEALRAAGLDADPADVDAVMGLPKPEAFRLLIGKSPEGAGALGRLDEIHADFVARMLEYYRADPSVAEVEGVSGLFAALRGAGVLVGLNTGFSRPITRAILDRLGWERDGLVAASVSSDEVPRGRPWPDMIARLMEDLGVEDASAVAKVGDAPADLLEGNNAGCRLVVGVTWGSHSRAQLAGYPHTHLVDSVEELANLLLGS